jgi:hypothetical protein
MLWRISRRDPPAGFIQPCQPTLVAVPPAGPGRLHEVKHEGYRILARKQGEHVVVWGCKALYGKDSRWTSGSLKTS